MRLHICLLLERREEESVLHDVCHDPSSLTLGRRWGKVLMYFYGRNRSYLYSFVVSTALNCLQWVLGQVMSLLKVSDN